MPTIDVTTTVPVSIATAEAAWNDTARWPRWLEGFDQLLEVGQGWPAVGSAARWRSIPAGRGTVTVTVKEHEAGSGQMEEIVDDTTVGQQTVTFGPAKDGAVEVAVSLTYRITKRSPFTAVFDLLFVKRVVRTMQRDMLERFAAMLSFGE
jgi:uncharacterized membrane protein